MNFDEMYKRVRVKYFIMNGIPFNSAIFFIVLFGIKIFFQKDELALTFEFFGNILLRSLLFGAVMTFIRYNRFYNKNMVLSRMIEFKKIRPQLSEEDAFRLAFSRILIESFEAFPEENIERMKKNFWSKP